MISDLVSVSSQYLAELSLLDLGFIKYPPSVIAASALLIAINATKLFGHGNQNWDPTMEYFTTYTFSDLEPCATRLLAKGREQLAHGAQFRAVREKYMQTKFDRVAEHQLPEHLKP